MGFQVHKIPILLNTFSILLKNKKADFSAFEWFFNVLLVLAVNNNAHDG